MSKLTVETDKYGLVRVKVETTKSGTPVTYRAPANTGLSGQNDQAIAAIVEKINETDDLIPQDTSSENPLVNEKAVRELILNTKQAITEDLEARKFKVIAKALCELKATLDGVVEAVTSENIGTRTADSLDVQELLIGGTVFDPSELNNTKSVSVINSDIRKSISELSDELEATEETETETNEVFGKTSADKNEK
jgi:hypothetical protein